MGRTRMELTNDEAIPIPRPSLVLSWLVCGWMWLLTIHSSHSPSVSNQTKPNLGLTKQKYMFVNTKLYILLIKLTLGISTLVKNSLIEILSCKYIFLLLFLAIVTPFFDTSLFILVL